MDRLVRIAIAPLLLVQGWQVRRTALKLPEPRGPRQGRVGNGPELRLLIAGDSSGAGVGVPEQDQALAGQLVQALSQDFTVDWRLIARTGATTLDALSALKSQPSSPMDVAVFALGVNDVTGLTSVKDWLHHQETLLDHLHQILGTQMICVSAIPPIEHFPALPFPLRWILGKHARRLHSARQRHLSQKPGYVAIDFHMPLTPDLMAEDGFHPNAKAYALWAKSLARQIKATFSDR